MSFHSCFLSSQRTRRFLSKWQASSVLTVAGWMVSPNVFQIPLWRTAAKAYVNEAFKAGASGYLLKRSAGSELVQAIQSVMNGHHYVTPLIAKDLLQSVVTGRKPPVLKGQDLTPRQREVLQLVAKGRTVKEVAASLNISPKTVEFISRSS